ncbi:hypothetical protein MUP95_01585 [bacterium]|nr:hypothetical protein [bacterium]
MTIGCNQIVDCILKNCANLVPGIKDMAYFINYDCVDKDLSTFDPSNSLLLTQLVLKSGLSPDCVAYCVEGYNFSNEHKTSLVKKTYQKVWEHGFIFRIFDNTPETKLWIQNAVDSRFIIIQENNYNKNVPPLAAGRTIFEVLGWDFGLELNAAERDANSDELLGGWLLTAGCADKLKESLPPLAYFNTSIANTRAMIHSLLAPCCPAGTSH